VTRLVQLTGLGQCPPLVKTLIREKVVLPSFDRLVTTVRTRCIHAAEARPARVPLVRVGRSWQRAARKGGLVLMLEMTSSSLQPAPEPAAPPLLTSASVDVPTEKLAQQSTLLVRLTSGACPLLTPELNRNARTNLVSGRALRLVFDLSFECYRRQSL
jgi:hypothetical protein